MPKVPVYQSQATPTTDTGMVSYTRAQMDSRPFIQAALAEGETAATAATMISGYLEGRVKAEGDLAANNALMAAEAAMQQTSSELMRSSKPELVFGDDITSEHSWAGSVSDIGSKLRADLNPYAKRQFNSKFGALSAKYGAQLRVKNDERIDKILVSQFELSLQNFELMHGDVNNSAATESQLRHNLLELKNRALELGNSGRIDPAKATDAIQKSINTVAENAAALFINQSASPIETINMLMEGDEEDLIAIAEMDGGLYVMQLLDSYVPEKADRLAILEKLREQAHKSYRDNKALEKDEEARIKANNTKLFNSLFDPTATPTEIEEGIASLEKQDFLTPAMRKTLKDLSTGQQVFRTSDEGDDQDVLTELESLVPNGLLTLEALLDKKSSLTQATFRSLMNDVGTARKDAWTAMSKSFEIEFGYAEEMGNDIEEYEQAAKTSYRRASRLWNRYKRDNPTASSAEMQTEMQRIIDNEWKSLDKVLTIELNAMISDMDTRIAGLKGKFPKINGKYDVSAVREILADYILSSGQSNLGVKLDELNYLIAMLEDRNGS